LSSDLQRLRWHNVLTGESVQPEEREGTVTLSAANLFGQFPVALLLSKNE
jgi:hypothetical protein